MQCYNDYSTACDGFYLHRKCRLGEVPWLLRPFQTDDMFLGHLRFGMGPGYQVKGKKNENILINFVIHSLQGTN